jgi:hypothetical protein
LKLSNETSFLNRAKLLNLIISTDTKEQRQFAWASSVLFAKMLEWDEFQDVRKVVDDYIAKVYEKYQLLKTKTTKDLLGIDRELAMFKYAVDKQLQEGNKTPDTAEVEDRYAYIAVVRFFDLRGKEKAIKEIQPAFEEAFKKDDPLLYAKFLKEEKPLATDAIVRFVKENPASAAAVGAGGVALGIIGAGTLYLRKKKQEDKKEE